MSGPKKRFVRPPKGVCQAPKRGLSGPKSSGRMDETLSAYLAHSPSPLLHSLPLPSYTKGVWFIDRNPLCFLVYPVCLLGISVCLLQTGSITYRLIRYHFTASQCLQSPAPSLRPLHRYKFFHFFSSTNNNNHSFNNNNNNNNHNLKNNNNNNNNNNWMSYQSVNLLVSGRWKRSLS